MINTVADISEIQFEFEQPNDELLESIRKRGLAIAVQVDRKEGYYVCRDGRKRLSACTLLKEENPSFARIPIMILNDYSKAGSSFWGNTQNKH